MSDLETILAAAPVPANPDNLPWHPWPVLDKIDVAPRDGTTRSWTFHYSDGTSYTTEDREHAELISRTFFPVGPGKTNT